MHSANAIARKDTPHGIIQALYSFLARHLGVQAALSATSGSLPPHGLISRIARHYIKKVGDRSPLRCGSPTMRIVSKSGDILRLRQALLLVATVFDGADADTVPALLGEHVADTFALSIDAVSADFVLVDEGIFHCLCTCIGKTYVDFLGAVGRSITLDVNLGVFVVLQIGSYHLDIGLLVGSDCGRTYAEEYETYAVEDVGFFFYLNNFGFAVLASSQFVSKTIGLGFPSGGVSVAVVQLATEVVDLTVKGIDFGLVEGLNASEAGAEVVCHTCLQVEYGAVCIIVCVALRAVAIHVPSDAGLEGNGHLLRNIEVEVQANLGYEVVVVGTIYQTFCFYIAGVEVVSPTGTGKSLDGEGTCFALVTAEEVEEINLAIDTYIRVVESGARVDFLCPGGGVDAELAFNAESEGRSNLLVDMQTYQTTHVGEE